MFQETIEEKGGGGKADTTATVLKLYKDNNIQNIWFHSYSQYRLCRARGELKNVLQSRTESRQVKEVNRL